MSETVFVVPAPIAEGEPPRVVRHPARGYAILPAEGDDWPLDLYTAARLRDVDVVEGSRSKLPALAELAPTERAARRSSQ